ncbi:hypothetical protein VN97_g6860 [Penicillium thymicola]|uniref:Uncharacterized protein n=1 Tax=Penicillium thymicola TaxID=293382 RepID=A0AAI9TFL0_PENTH|nr:hypothetical protein VN97_g6860 [Penicillium thymicola]
MKPSSNTHQATSFIFGGHIGPQTKNSLEKEVRKIANGPNGGWILDTLAGMPRYWEAVTEKIPEVASTMQGPSLLADLESWFRIGSDSVVPLAPDAELPDLWLGILMVAIQLDQYWRYLESRLADRAVDDLQVELIKENKVEAVGFCAGMIAAVAIASSHTRQEFEKYGAVALRIAALMAVLVGATEEWTKAMGKGRSVSLATAWRTRKQGDDLAHIVSKLSPDAYISVILDESRVTVTVSERLAPKLVRQLRAAGVTAIQLPFKGQLHSPTAEREHLTEAVIEMCHSMPELQYPDAAQLALPINQVSGQETGLVGMVLRSMLVKQLNWTSTASRLALNKEELSRVEFGLDRPLPPPVVRAFGAKLDYKEVDVPKHRPHNKGKEPVHDTESVQVAEQPRQEADENAIAVVGMSLKVAGANDLEEFQQMLKTGQSQHQLITDDQITPNMMFRDKDPNRKWYGNFVRDPDAFDHKFFKKSPRESTSIDPQGRLSLEAAYQALQQSGYFNELAMTSAAEQERKKHVGVYVGLCSYEYDSNVHCHPPSAFTTTGELRSFIPGRVSHYFGWTGPSLTFDTACSSSTVALHNACRDLLSGEVPAAMCGGVNVLTSLQWTQNLAAGSFISPTGQCKPFDSGADGYCRGDGIAYVFLKKLSTAVADGNTVLGTICSTGVNQNLNTTPLFVPNVPSLSTLFNEVIRKAYVDPRDISLVECHGTGTPVGDPAEWQSIRNAVAGPRRDTVLPIGSAKGHVGHTEGASGLVSLIKVLLMMRGNFIPPQASFNTMNPGIHAQPSDNMEVVTALRSWAGARKVALLNNYGACGSNSSAIVAHSAHKSAKATLSGGQRLPFWISGLDARSIAAYSTALAPYLQSQDQVMSLADVSFNMKWQSNPGLSQGMIFSCGSLDELHAKLAQAAKTTKDTAPSVGIAPVKRERPIILCFGGQVSTFIGLDRAVYEGAAVFRHHLDTCNAAITSHGLKSIYPDIFSSEPYQDTIKLQTALFAAQYASTKAWMDCGIADKVVSVVGHSFGEITALCVAGVLSLEDTVKLIAGRARLVQTAWGADSGSMMAIEANEAVVQDLLQESNTKSDGTAGIACYNGPRSFTVAGSTTAIDAFAATLPGKEVKSKRLNVTNAFHSALVESIVDRLGEIGKGVTFHDAVIPIERATEHGGDSTLDWTFVGSHMRQPVFFNHAVQRLAEKHPEAIFLEAGSNSTITVMASRALANPQPTHHFQSISITNTNKGIDRLTDATVDLWKQGLRVSFWAHHRLQKDEYAQLLLPPYQFEKTRHWLELKSPIEQAMKIAQVQYGTKAQQEHVDPKSLDMWTFLGFQEHKKKGKLARFRINTYSDMYQRLFATHFIAKTAPIAPATLEIDLAIETLFSLSPEWRRSGFSPIIRDMLSHSPMCADSTREYLLDLESLNPAETEWQWTIHSTGASSANDKHAEGRIAMYSSSDPAALQEFGRWKRIVTYAQCQAVLALGPHDDGVEALQGRNVYRAFEEVVDFGSVYRGVKYIVGQEKGESAGIVHKQHSGDTWLDVPKADCYGQIAGMYVNLLTDIPASDMFVATGLELVMRSPKAQTVTDGRGNGPNVWHVLARHARQGEKAYVTDIFVFDASTGVLAEVILGLQYVRVPKATMSKILERVTTDKSFVRSTATASLPLPDRSQPRDGAITATAPKPAPPKATKASVNKTKPVSGTRNIAKEVCNVVANVSGIEPSELSLDSEMADLGIDSLMAMEVAREMENTFHCTLDSTETMVATTIRDFASCVSNALARSGDQDGDSTSTESDVLSDSLDEDTDSDISTPDDASDITSKSQDPVSDPLTPAIQNVDRGDVAAREAEALRLVKAYTAGWESPTLEDANDYTVTTGSGAGAVVIVTGASGSLGSHIVQALAERLDVASVVCINRAVKDTPPESRQEEALSSRGITLSPAARKKLQVYGIDTSKAQLGLSKQEYNWLAQHGTHIIHNAWPMSATRPLKAFEPQLQVMRNLLDLARDMAVGDEPRRIGFQFISSIGVTGFSNESPILEQPMAMAAAIPSGYNEAKWACERMLTDTLRRHPQLFQAMVARPGQISGSTASGFWNPVEHFAFVVKSAHALKVFPDLQGVLHWLPVDKSANVMVDLLNISSGEDSGEVYPVYHVDNPVGQSWKEMVTVLAASLDIPSHDIVPFREWIKRVRQSSLPPAQNPASMGLGFLESHFERMACGGIVLDTHNSKEHSDTMAAQGPVSAEVVRSYVSSWKAMGFLHH